MKKKTAALILTLFAAASLLSASASAASHKLGNMAPIAENIKITTYKGVRVTGTLKASDPNGDAVSFEVTEEPQKGSVEMRENGNFIYRPYDGKSGKDSFSYTAHDDSGSRSAEAQVEITIKKQSTEVCYCDIEECESCYEAVRLAECGIFQGECLAGQYYFHPADTVTRGEFLTMCMKAANVEPIPEITRTSFADDNEISKCMKPYVAAALVSGYISGRSSGTSSVFSADDVISKAEAAVMLNNVLELTDTASVGAFEADTESWSVQASCNLSSCGIISAPFAGTEAVLRADAAEMISNAIDVLAERGKSFSLFGRKEIGAY